MADRAITYAEQNLHVHDVWDEAKEAQRDLREAQKAAVEYAQQKRTLIEAMNERTAQFTAAERGRLSDISATAFEQHLKTALQLDPALMRLRQEYSAAQSQHDLAEASVREAEFRCRMYAARMEELGGLLNFYAATKQAAVARGT